MYIRKSIARVNENRFMVYRVFNYLFIVVPSCGNSKHHKSVKTLMNLSIIIVAQIQLAMSSDHVLDMKWLAKMHDVWLLKQSRHLR